MIRLFLLTLAATPAAIGHAQNLQDHQYTSADIQNGARLYAAQCALCHGPTGDGVSGIDLRRGVFRRVSSDDDIANVLQTGIAAVGMPAFTFPAADVTGIIAYIRAGFDPTGTPVKVGNAARGQALVEGKGRCLTCHRINGRGLRTAPDLSDIGAQRTAGVLQRSLLDPTSAMWPINRPVRIVTKNGRTIRGRRLNEDTFTVQLIDEEEQLVSLDKADIKALEVGKTSTMPPASKVLSPDEIADVVAYLLSLRGM